MDLLEKLLGGRGGAKIKKINARENREKKIHAQQVAQRV